MHPVLEGRSGRILIKIPSRAGAGPFALIKKMRTSGIGNDVFVTDLAD
jgi:hypothetical protein